MTVKEWIVGQTLRQTKRRRDALEKVNAPKTILESADKYIEALERGEIRIGGDRDALNDEWRDSETKTGRGGKTYYLINGNIRFFPDAQYGMFVKRVPEDQLQGAV